MPERSFLGPLLLAFLLTLLNTCKPLQGDESAYWVFSRHIAEHPFDPYGFQFAGDVPANHVLAPPLLLYWWALAIHLFGVQPIVWKLWLLPFSLLLVFALRSLFHRFCRDWEAFLLWSSVLSPTVLPGFGLMLDVPALALSLTAVVLLLRAEERHSMVWAGLAGVVAGLAMQTKYTAFVTPGLFLLRGLVIRDLRRSIVAFLLALAIFGGWELVIAHWYGESHFVHSLVHRSHGLGRLAHLLLPLLSILGSAAPALGLLALVAFQWSRRAVCAAGVSMVVGFLLLVLLPARFLTLPVDAPSSQLKVPLENLVFGFWGAVLVVLLGRVAFAILRQGNRAAEPGSALAPSALDSWFLVGWLLLEVAAYFALSPLPGARRVLALVVVGTLVTGRLACMACRSPSSGRLLHGAALSNIVLGLALFTVDVWDARADAVAARQVARWLPQKPPEARAWFITEGWCGFQFYANCAGFTQVGMPGVAGPASGDWVAVLHRFAVGRTPSSEHAWGELLSRMRIEDSLPLQTDPNFYSRRVAVAHHEGPRVEVSLYRLP